jgi:hypothetical protein
MPGWSRGQPQGSTGEDQREADCVETAEREVTEPQAHDHHCAGGEGSHE